MGRRGRVILGLSRVPRTCNPSLQPGAVRLSELHVFAKRAWLHRHCIGLGHYCGEYAAYLQDLARAVRGRPTLGAGGHFFR